MAKVTVHIPNVAWRAGRPRFVPGPALRRLGFTGRDLKRSDGTWMSLDEAVAEADMIAQKIVEARAAKPRQAKQIAATIRPPAYTLDDLLDGWLASPRLSGVAIERGRMRRAPLAPKTVQEYRKLVRTLRTFDPELCLSPAGVLTGSQGRAVAHDLYERLYQAKGLHMARATVRALSAALSWAIKAGRVSGVNGCTQLGMETPSPRLRVATTAEIAALLDAADTSMDWGMGDAILMGAHTGQRQADRLAWRGQRDVAGRLVFRQAKGRGRVVVQVPATPALAARLAEAADRRRALAARMPVSLEIVISYRTGRLLAADEYRKRFAAIRAVAAQTCPSVATLTDQDLRDTAVTRLAAAGCSVPEICAITGHTLQSAHQVLRHYLATDAGMADTAIAKLVAMDEAGTTP